MAPRNQNPNDPSKIDVALEIVGQEGRDAISDLATQVQALREYMATGSMSGAAGSRIGNAGIRDSGAARSHSADVGVHPVDEAGLHASLPVSAEEQALRAEGNMTLWRRARANAAQGRFSPQEFISRELDVYGARERQQFAERNLGSGDYTRPGLHAGGGVSGYSTAVGGRPSGSASIPTPEYGEPRARYNLRSNPVDWAAGEETATIPQFGEMTIQDKLAIGAGFLQRSGERAYQSRRQDIQNAQDAMQGVGTAEQYAQLAAAASGNNGNNRFLAAGLMRQAGEFSGKLYPVVNDLRRVGGFLGDTRAAGISAGYGAGGTIGVGPIGVYNPFSPAMKEGLRQRWDTARLRMKGGINGEQAAGIVGGLAANGFVGGEGSDLAMDVMSPLVQQGLNPEITAAQLSEAIRNGATPAKEFRETLNELGPAARAARMSLDEFQQSLGGFANEMQGMGATYGQGYQLGRNLSTGLNLAPQQISPLMQNPIVQGQGLRQGYLPQTMGLMGANQAASSIYAGVNLAWNASGFFNKPIVDEKTGHVTTVDQQRNAYAASILGVSPDEFQKLYKNQKMGQAAAGASDTLSNLEDALNRTNQKGKGNLANVVNGAIKPGDLVPTSKNTPGAEKVGDHYFIRATVAGNGPRLENAQALDHAKAAIAHGSGATKASVDKQLLEIAKNAPDADTKKEWMDRVKDIRGKKGKDYTKAARGFVEEASKQALETDDNKPVVYVKFKGKAEKFFQQDLGNNAKRDSDSGVAQINSHAIGPRATESAFNSFMASP